MSEQKPRSTARRDARVSQGPTARCRSCQGGPVTVERENYHHTESGLPNVTLVGVEVRRCAECGQATAIVRNVEGLHRALACAVARKRTRLTAAEIRFLRTYLGWSGVEFARHIGTTPVTVSRWEHGTQRMATAAERLLRLMVLTREPVSEYALNDLAEIDETKAARPARFSVRAEPDGWRAEAGSSVPPGPLSLRPRTG